MGNTNPSKQVFADLASALEDYLKMIVELRIEAAALRGVLEESVAGFPDSYSKHRTKAEKASAERDHAALRRIYGILARLREG